MADFLWMLLVVMLTLDILGLIFEMPVLLGALTTCLIYIWAKRNPGETV